MNVELINYTANAAQLLVFTKSTRLEMNPDLFTEIMEWPQEKLEAELAYMADTIPSSWEFVDYTFLITGVSRAFTHQFVRNRTGSYAQQSMRVTDQSKYEYVSTAKTQLGEYYETYMKSCTEYAYSNMIQAGETIEDTRGILPTNIATNIVAKFNLRTMSDLAKSRTGGRTQGEHQKVMNLMVDKVLEVHPWADKFLFNKARDYFNDIEEFAKTELDGNVKMKLLKIVDKMRKSK